MKIYTRLFYTDIYKENLFLIFICFVYSFHKVLYPFLYDTIVKIECQAHIQIWGLGTNFGEDSPFITLCLP